MPTSDSHDRRAYQLERQRQLSAAKTELRDVLRTAQQLERDLDSGMTGLGSRGRSLASSTALLLERLAALDALENVSYLVGED